ncbi:MAG: NAD(P)H-dependent oxidoreductase subunit E, partial [Gammaproteobacteria bacterium]
MNVTTIKKRGQIRGRAVDLKALAEVRELLGEEPRRRDLLVEHLHRIQDRYHFISAAHIVALAEAMGLATTEVYEVATFYHHFDVVKEGERTPPALTVRVCDSITCELFGARELIAGLEERLGEGVRVQHVPCVGRCQAAPVAVVGQNPIEAASVERVEDAVIAGETEAPLPACVRYGDYRREGGYEILVACAEGRREPEAIVKLLEDSKLRGLGGAGFPAGRKWRILLDQPKPRLVAINIDEGEPGTFKDRHYLERDPHRFLEGMLIAAWAIEAEAVYIYLRDEYAGCRRMLAREIEALTEDPPCP